jgi:hypothetical protein
VIRDRRRPEGEGEQGGDERNDETDLGGAQIECLVRNSGANVVMKHRGDEAQHVHSGEHDREGADDRPAPADREDPVQDEELGGEGARPGHGERHHPGRDQQGGEHWAPARQSAEEDELSSRRAPLDRPREEEQSGRDEPVVDHLQDRAVQPGVVRCEEADHDQAHLREARVRDDAAYVRRTKRDERSVHEPDRGERQNDRAEVGDHSGKRRERDREDAVRGRLRDDAG